MIIEVKVPQFSESVSEGTLVSWKKQVGEAIARDEILIDIETDKVVLEVPAPDAGVLVELLKADGDLVTSGEIIARIDTSAVAAAPAPAATAASAPAAAATASATTASPAARKILEEKGIPAAAVSGTGRGGRVTKEDAVAASAAPKAAPVSAPTALPPGERIEQ
ncbi:MAG: E3 binding domain-containing protein, partial [Zoogloeaceae bacterium]|nr:E3 binding domain-containing protein [Zoogloeaceae bacterium]